MKPNDWSLWRQTKILDRGYPWMRLGCFLQMSNALLCYKIYILHLWIYCCCGYLGYCSAGGLCLQGSWNINRLLMLRSCVCLYGCVFRSLFLYLSLSLLSLSLSLSLLFLSFSPLFLSSLFLSSLFFSSLFLSSLHSHSLSPTLTHSLCLLCYGGIVLHRVTFLRSLMLQIIFRHSILTYLLLGLPDGSVVWLLHYSTPITFYWSPTRV